MLFHISRYLSPNIVFAKYLRGVAICGWIWSCESRRDVMESVACDVRDNERNDRRRRTSLNQSSTLESRDMPSDGVYFMNCSSCPNQLFSKSPFIQQCDGIDRSR